MTITPAPLTITADNQTKVYGQANPAFTASFSGFVLEQDPTALSGTLGFSTSSSTASHVGLYPITPNGLTSTNYAISFINGNESVTPAPLQVTAPDVVTIYGQAVPTLTAIYSGFVNGDTPSNLTTPVGLSTTASPSSNVGTYPVVASGATSSDYTVSYTNGSASITPATLTVTPDNQVEPYGTALPALTASYSGYVNGDTAASLTTPVSLSTTATSGSDFGTYPITASGGGSPNYTIVYGQGTLTVPVDPAQTAFVTSLYQDILGRDPEMAGLDGWLARLNNGVSQSSVVSQIYNSPEAVADRATQGVQANPQAAGQIGLVTALYQTILGRAPETAGLNGWLARLDSGQTVEQVAQEIYNSAEAIADRGAPRRPRPHRPTRSTTRC